VVYNSLTSVFWLGEPYLRRDILGVILIFGGVAFVVASQLGSHTTPVTTSYITHGVLPSPSFWVYIGCIAVGMLWLIVWAQPRYGTKYSWVFLTQSALMGSLSTVAARMFSSLLGSPLPGEWANVYQAPACYYVWSSLLLLACTAGSSLVMQNKAMMHFENSEVVPIYFCLFAVGGVLGAALAYQEVCYPSVMYLVPGLLFCMGGVLVICYKRDKRVTERLSRQAAQRLLSEGGQPPVTSQQQLRGSLASGHTGVEGEEHTSSFSQIVYDTVRESFTVASYSRGTDTHRDERSSDGVKRRSSPEEGQVPTMSPPDVPYRPPHNSS